MKLGRWFDTLPVALVPVALLLGIGFGVQFTTGQYPNDMIGKAVAALVGGWIGIMVIWWLLDVVAGGLIEQLETESQLEPNEGQPGELVMLLLRDGEVVQEIRSWDKPADRGRRQFWAKRLPKLLTKRAQQ
jgi:hypothetical protein